MAGPNGPINRQNNYTINTVEKEDLQMQKRTLKL